MTRAEVVQLLIKRQKALVAKQKKGRAITSTSKEK